MLFCGMWRDMKQYDWAQAQKYFVKNLYVW